MPDRTSEAALKAAVEGTITDKDGNDITETVKEAEAYFKTFIDWVN